MRLDLFYRYMLVRCPIPPLFKPINARQFWPRPYGRVVCLCREKQVCFKLAELPIEPAQTYTVTEIECHHYRLPNGFVHLYFGQCKSCGLVPWGIIRVTKRND